VLVATPKQYEFFKLLFDEEIAREKKLVEQARNYLSLATLYSALLVYISATTLSLIGKILSVAAVLSIAAIVAEMRTGYMPMEILGFEV
jgi:hypothetical protein